MTKEKDFKSESLAEIVVDPDVLAKELAVELEIDPLEQIDNDSFSKENVDITLECLGRAPICPSDPGTTTISTGSDTIIAEGVTTSKLVVSAIFTSSKKIQKIKRHLFLISLLFLLLLQ